MSLKPDTFTFMFYVSNPKNAKLDVFENIRKIINNIVELRNSQIVMSQRKISVQSKDFYLAFRRDKDFNMGFTCGQEKIDFLNDILNDITTKLSFKTASCETITVDYFASAEFLISKDFNPIEKILQSGKIESLLDKNWKISTKKVELSCSNENVKNQTLDISLLKEDNGNILHLYFFKDNNKDFTRDAAKKALDEINIFANKILKELK